MPFCLFHHLLPHRAIATLSTATVEPGGVTRAAEAGATMATPEAKKKSKCTRQGALLSNLCGRDAWERRRAPALADSGDRQRIGRRAAGGCVAAWSNAPVGTALNSGLRVGSRLGRVVGAGKPVRCVLTISIRLNRCQACRRCISSCAGPMRKIPSAAPPRHGQAACTPAPAHCGAPAAK